MPFFKNSPAHHRRHLVLLVVLLFSLFLVSCNYSTVTPQPVQDTQQPPATPTLAVAPSPTPLPPRLLTVCLGQEPTSLFLYGDAFPAARAVRSAIYDGPLDTLSYQMQPVILEQVPDLANGGVLIEPVQVEPGSVLADPSGGLATLQEGALYLPVGCRDAACAQTYAGAEPVTMDQMVVRFTLRSGIFWSDGQPLTAADSVYSYELARALFPRYRPELLNYTVSYTALDEVTLEWRGLPGYQDALYRTFFFSPLPMHAWNSLPPAELMASEQAARSPLGWGAFIIEEWVAGDHIALRKNPGYFRSADGLPHFDRLVFRFVSSGPDALAALTAGECDLLDETALADVQPADLQPLQDAGSLQVISGGGSAWEQIAFGITPADPARPAIFKSREMRQAVAFCLDRAGLVSQLFPGQAAALESYVPGDHPAFNPAAPRYSLDLPAAASLLDAAGWLDVDQNPQTPRLSMGVPGLADGTPLEIGYLTIAGALRQQVGQWLQTSLAQCGISVRLEQQSWEDLFAPGPDGAVFGRKFDLAQFGWTIAQEPPCFLFTSGQIPGPYPEFPERVGRRECLRVQQRRVRRRLQPGAYHPAGYGGIRRGPAPGAAHLC